VLGIPLVLLEMGLGQVFQGGHAAALAAIHPRLRGFGTASVVCAVLVTAYYCQILGLSICYFLASLTSAALPWAGGGDSSAQFFDSVTEVSGGVGEVTKLAWQVENAVLVNPSPIFLAT
jgi:solute carrier family 6 GABA transporter-like protein 1